MCPFCFATMALVAAGVTSAGGVTALAVKLALRKTTNSVPNSNERMNENDDHAGKA
jgi:hypothetical protein